MNFSEPSQNRVARNVTAENFTKKAVAFIKTSESEAGFVVALKNYPGRDPDEPFKPTVRQWGAWMSYWAKIGYKTKAMQERGYATTPTEWPHEFDADATVQGDHQAADAFEAKHRDQREREKFQAGGIVGRAARSTELWRQTRKEMQKPTPKEHLEPEAAPAVDISDFPSATATAAELREWGDRQKQRGAV